MTSAGEDKTDGLRVQAERIAALASHDPVAALAACCEAIDAFPDQARLHRARVKLLLTLGRGAEAEPDLRRVLQLEPNHVKSMTRLARLCEQRLELQEASALLAAALVVEPDNVPLILRYGELLSRAGDHEGAVKQYAAALQLAPDERVRRLHASALQRSAADLHAGATADVKRICLKGAEHLRAGQAAEAEACFQEAVVLCPGYASAWLGLRGARHARALAEGREGGAAAVMPGAPAPEAFLNRPLSRRGLLFDPKDRFAICSRDQALTRVDTPAQLQAADNAFLVLDSGGDIVEHRPLLDLGAEQASETVVRFQTSESFIMSLRWAMLVGRGAVITDCNAVIRDISFQHTPADKYLASIRKNAFVFDQVLGGDGVCAIRSFDTPALLMAGPRDRSYGDWIINFPPRLALAEAAQLDCPIVVNADIPPQYLDMLAALGAPRDGLLFHDPAGVSVFPKLYTPSWPLAERRRPMAAWLDVYGRARTRPSERGTLLYVSRRSVSHRPLVNEAEVCDLFVRKGFKVIQPERLSFAETQAVFASAACVAGPYGSGLRNLVFCSRTPVALVLMPPYSRAFVEGVMIWIAESGARFAGVTGQTAPGAGSPGDPNEDPWFVPLDQVSRAIDATLEILQAKGGRAIA